MKGVNYNNTFWTRKRASAQATSSSSESQEPFHARGCSPRKTWAIYFRWRDGASARSLGIYSLPRSLWSRLSDLHGKYIAEDTLLSQAFNCSWRQLCIEILPRVKQKQLCPRLRQKSIFSQEFTITKSRAQATWTSDTV